MSYVPRRRRADDGFTLIEVLVALTLLGLVAAAVTPLLVLSARASTVVRFETIAKNLVQERLEQMRQLPFQVSRQNGPFIDLLDYYYPTRIAATTGNASGWVSAASTLRGADEPSGAYYRVVVPEVPGHPLFGQVVTAQFLRSDRTVVPEGTFTTYTSQTAGLDGPPSSYLGVNVITTWFVGSKAHRSVVYTELSNPGTTEALISSQAQATAVRVQSTAPDLTALTLVAGRISAEGRLSDGSTSSVRAAAAEATREGASPLRGAYLDAAAPGSVTSGTLDVGHQSAGSSPSCGYAGFGRSQNSDLTPSVDSGLPKLPATVGTSATTPAVQARTALLTNSGGSCGTFSFDNLSSGAYDPRLRLQPDVPLVRLPDLSSGSVPALDATGWLNATATSASPRFVTAGSSARTAEPVAVLPVSFAEDGRGLLGVRLVSSGITCSSSGTPVSASYRVIVDVYRSITTVSGSVASTTKGRQVLVDHSWTSASGPVPPSINMSTVVYDDGAGTVLTLSDYFADLVLASSVSPGSTNGAASLDAAFRAATRPVRGVAAPESGVELRLGTLACAAVDAR